jgi:hypothetical protein
MERWLSNGTEPAWMTATRAVLVLMALLSTLGGGSADCNPNVRAPMNGRQPHSVTSSTLRA